MLLSAGIDEGLPILILAHHVLLDLKRQLKIADTNDPERAVAKEVESTVPLRTLDGELAT